MNNEAMFQEFMMEFVTWTQRKPQIMKRQIMFRFCLIIIFIVSRTMEARREGVGVRAFSAVNKPISPCLWSSHPSSGCAKLDLLYNA